MLFNKCSINDRSVGTAVSVKYHFLHPTKCCPVPPKASRCTPTGPSQPGWRQRTRSKRQGMLNDSHRRRPSHGIPEPEQEAERRLLRKQWPGTSVMRGCTPHCLQQVRGTSQWWLSFLSPPFRGHFWLLQWALCPLPAFCQHLTLQACSFFASSLCLHQKTKQLKPRLFNHLPLLLFFIMTFG